MARDSKIFIENNPNPVIGYTGTDNLTTYGAIDLTSLNAADLATVETFTWLSNVRINASALVGKTVTVDGAGGHAIQIINDLVAGQTLNLSAITIKNGTATITTYAATGAGTINGTPTTTGGATANVSTTTGTPATGDTGGAGGGAVGVASNTLTNIADAFDNSVTPVVATLGGVDYKASYTTNQSATLYTAVANLADGDTLKFGTGTADTLIFTDAVTNLAINTTIADATVTALDILQLANTTNSVTVTSVATSLPGKVIQGGSATDQITFAGADQAVYVKSQAGNDVITLVSATNTSIDGGDGNDTIKFDTKANAATAATVIGGNGTDTIELTGATEDFVDATFAKMSGIETAKISGGDNGDFTLGILAFNAGIRTLEMNGATTITSLYGAAAPLTINGNAAADGKVITIAATSTGNMTVTTALGADFTAVAAATTIGNIDIT